MTTAAVEPKPKTITEESVRDEANAIVLGSTAIVIVDQATYDAAAAFLTERIKPAIKKVEEYFDPDIAQAHSLHKSLCNKKKALVDPLVAAENKVKAGVLDFARKAEEERLRIQRELEDKARKEQEEAILQTAIQAEEHGATEEEKQTILNTPTYTPPIVAAPTFQKAAGISVKGSWKAEVTDVVKLCAFIVKNPHYAHLVEPDMAKLNALARTMQKNFNIEGARAFEAGSIAARATK